MITTVNLRVPTVDAGGKSPLLEQLAKKADANRDGTVTSAEFTAFVSTLMESLDAEQKPGIHAGADKRAEHVPQPGPTFAAATKASPAAAIEALRRAISRIEGE